MPEKPSTYYLLVNPDSPFNCTCPSCGLVYGTGKVYVEYEEQVVCHVDPLLCPECKEEIYIPFMWDTMDEGRAFMKACTACSLAGQLISKNILTFVSPM